MKKENYKVSFSQKGERYRGMLKSLVMMKILMNATR